MTFTFPSDRSIGHDAEFGIVYTDPACTNMALITDLNGSPLPGSQIVVSNDGFWPLFKCAISPVYLPVGGTGDIITLYPSDSDVPAQIVTGSKGGNVALASLITALIAAGVPIVDQTS
jgi:hypothetical protein